MKCECISRIDAEDSNLKVSFEKRFISFNESRCHKLDVFERVSHSSRIEIKSIERMSEKLLFYCVIRMGQIEKIRLKYHLMSPTEYYY